MSCRLPIVSVNGQSGASLSPFDRGFTYADGLFETLCLKGGFPPLWPFHWARLSEGCQRLGIPLDGKKLLAFSKALLAEAGHPDEGVLKLTVTRGEGSRGYSYGPEQEPTIVVGVFPAAAYPAENSTTGVALFECQQRLGINPGLAGFKVLNKLEYVLARSEWSSRDFTEGLMLDIDGRVTEGTVSNIFAVCGGELVTPPMDRCGVSGVMRRLVIERLALSAGCPVSEKVLYPDDLYAADEVFISNSVFGLWPVNRIGQTPLLTGEITLKLQQALEVELASTAAGEWAWE